MSEVVNNLSFKMGGEAGQGVESSGAGFAKGMGAIRFDLSRRHSSLANVAWGPQGLVHSYEEYKQKFGRP